MYGRSGLDRFKKAQSLEPFSVTAKASNKAVPEPAFRVPTPPGAAVSTNQAQALYGQRQYLNNQNVVQKMENPDVPPAMAATQQVTQVGGGQSTWQPPDWAIEPRPGVYYLDVIKDGEVLGKINMDKRKHIFGRQFHACDFVLDHQSVSRQHAAVVPHKNGSIYVIDLGSAHGTFVANERLTKDSPVELEVGQSLRFAASTRTYILRKNDAALFPPPPQLSEVDLPPLPDPSNEDAVLAYNTYINRVLNGVRRPDIMSKSTGSSCSSCVKEGNELTERSSKRIRRSRVAFKDQIGGELAEVVGYSDGADVETEPGPIGVKEGSLVGKYESLVQITVIPKGKEQTQMKDGTMLQKGVTEKLQQVLDKVKTPLKAGGIYDDLYVESYSDKVGSSWAYASVVSDGSKTSRSNNGGNIPGVPREKSDNNSGSNDGDDDDDDLFG